MWKEIIKKLGELGPLFLAYMEVDDKFPRAAAAEENNLTGHPKKQIDAGLVADVFMNIVNFEDSLLVIKF